MSHRKICGVPAMDNEDGRMLENGLIRGNSAPLGRISRRQAENAEGRFLACGRPRWDTMVDEAKTQGARGKA